MSSTYFGNLDTRELNRRSFLLINPFWCNDEEHTKIEVAAGFTTNFASIDIFHNLLLFVFYALLVGYGNKAATIHDWLYSGYGIKQGDIIYYPTRLECDDIFFRALRGEGVARWRAYILYWGVRIGGQSSYTAQAVFAPMEFTV